MDGATFTDDKGGRCDVPTDQERKTGRGDRLKLHRWPRPVALGDPCQCGERTADDVLVKVLNTW